MLQPSQEQGRPRMESLTLQGHLPKRAHLAGAVRLPCLTPCTTFVPFPSTGQVRERNFVCWTTVAKKEHMVPLTS